MNAAYLGRRESLYEVLGIWTELGKARRRAFQAWGMVWAEAWRHGRLWPVRRHTVSLSPSPSHLVPGCPLLRSVRFSRFDSKS